MSAARPMAAEARALGYTEIVSPDGTTAGYRRMTPGQWRRWRRKYNRAEGGYFGHWGSDCKGRPTPRQRKRQVAS